MRVLVVSYAYAPDILPRAFRWATIAERWVAQGHQVDVVCGPDLNKPVEARRNGVIVYRVGSRFVGRVRRYLNSRAMTFPNAGRGASTGYKNGLRAPLVRFFRWLHDRSWRLIYWPDLAGPWLFVARRHVRALAREHNYDAIITVSPLFTSHLVGLSCRRNLRGSIWLADYGDPFSYSETGRPANNRLLYGALNHWVENRVLQFADVVSVTTNETRELYARLFPTTKVPVVVVPPLIPKLTYQDGATKPPRVAASEDKIVLTYTGHFYPGVREPGPLLALIEAFLDVDARYRGRLQVHIIGPLDRVEASFRAFRRWPGVIKLLGQLPPELARKEIDVADGLINIGNMTSYQLPSKVVEYAASGKPILNLCLSEKDSSARFFDSYPLVCNILMNGSSNSQAVGIFRKFLDEMIGQRVDPDLIEELVAPYSPEKVAAQYADLIARN